MPKPLIHLWIAQRLSQAYPHLQDPDFYLGSILPDAIFSRDSDISQNHCITHLYRDAKMW